MTRGTPAQVDALSCLYLKQKYNANLASAVATDDRPWHQARWAHAQWMQGAGRTEAQHRARHRHDKVQEN